MPEPQNVERATSTALALFLCKPINCQCVGPAAEVIIMNTEEAKSILKLMGAQFDSHEFIVKFIYHFTAAYGQILVKHNNVAHAHSEIAKFLRQNESNLMIRKTGEHTSPDIFGTPALCATWEKTI